MHIVNKACLCEIALKCETQKKISYVLIDHSEDRLIYDSQNEWRRMQQISKEYIREIYKLYKHFNIRLQCKACRKTIALM